MRTPICLKCKYLRSIDVDGIIHCEKEIHGKAKVYCREFKPNEP